MLDELLPDRARLRAVFEKVGFRCSHDQVVKQTVAPSWEAYADKLAAGADSVLSRVSSEELSSGLDAVRRHDPGPRGRAVIEPIDVFFFRVKSALER